jgi:hypothetical protein
MNNITRKQLGDYTKSVSVERKIHAVQVAVLVILTVAFLVLCMHGDYQVNIL